MTSLFRDERIWRWLTNFWTIALIAFLITNFVSNDAYDVLSAPLSILYTGVLGMYAGTKEFDRWYEMHDSRHPGELFIGIWTVVIVAFFLISMLIGRNYRLSEEAVTDYIVVLSIFALTQKSKNLHKRKHSK